MNHMAAHVRRLIATIIGSTLSVLALSGTAFAYTDPIRQDVEGSTPGGAANAQSVVAPPAPVHAGWSLTAVLVAVLLALLVGWVAHIALQHVRGGHRAPAPALSS